eukprot:m.244566 g.244566  ORF g.244566 m.244566 type:complete len:508 (+) comp40247_c1_seq37:2127-3650(+)
MAAKDAPSDAVSVSSRDQLCKTGCGFHGNPQWDGYCSKCHAERILKLGSQSLSSGSGKTPVRPGSLSFANFEEKKKSQKTSKKEKVTQIFKKSGPGKAKETPQIASGLMTPTSRQETSVVVADFNEFLRTLKKPASQEIVASLKGFIDECLAKPHQPTEKHQANVEKFYGEMGQRLSSSSTFKGMSMEQMEMVMENVEKYIMTRLHGIFFSPNDTDDEAKDIEIQRLMKQLRWIEPSHLDFNLSEMTPEILKIMETAQRELMQIDTKKAPQDKVNCILRCSKCIFEILQSVTDGPAGANEFLPALIYIVIQGMPARLYSNIQYILRFGNNMRVSSGESSYYFTNLVCAVAFVQHISAESLHMSQDEFDGHMVSSRLLASPPEIAGGGGDEADGGNEDALALLDLALQPEGLSLPANNDKDLENASALPDLSEFEPLKIMKSSIQDMVDLSTKHEELRQRALAIQAEVEAFRQSQASEVQAILESRKTSSMKPTEDASNSPVQQIAAS